VIVMLRLPILLAALAALLLVVPEAQVLAAPEARTALGACPVPAEFAADIRPLPYAAKALETGTLSILVIGSASVSGGSGRSAEAAWPARMQVALQARYPSQRIEVSVRGGRGVTAAEHAQMLRDTDPGAALVVWQAGTVEAARGLDLDDMSDALLQGMERLHARHADVILMDQQFSRFLRANANIEPYREKMRMAAAAAGVPLFRRYDLMQSWAENGAVDLERTARAERAATVDHLNDCIGRALAWMIARGITAAR